jgi:hypothetical protein
MTNTNTVLKLYTLVIAITCALAVAWSISQSNAAVAWRSEAATWQTTAQRTVAQNRLTVRRYRRLTHRYDNLVVATRKAQRKLIAQMQASSVAAVSSPVPAVSSGVSVAAAPAPAPAPAPVATTVAPTTHTS